MKIYRAIGLASSLALGAVAAQAAGTVAVSFVQPETFTDVKDSFQSKERHLAALKRHFEEAAAPYVADGQTLKIEVLDVDLAGDSRFDRRLDNVRVLKGRADWPRITFRYALEAGSQAVRSGEARVQDMAYLNRITPLPLDTTLRYERRMLDEWFRDAFAGAAH